MTIDVEPVIASGASARAGVDHAALPSARTARSWDSERVVGRLVEPKVPTPFTFPEQAPRTGVGKIRTSLPEETTS